MMNMMLEEEIVTLSPRPALAGCGVGRERENMRQWNLSFAAGKDYYCENGQVYEPEVHRVASKNVDHGNQFLLHQLNMHSITESNRVHPDDCQVVSYATSRVRNRSIFLYIRTETSQDDQGGFIQTRKEQPWQGCHCTSEFCDDKSVNSTNGLSVHEENERSRSTAESKAICEVLLNFPVKNITNHPRLLVGCAVKAKKAESFLKPALFECARSKGIILSVIDHNKPLLEQGPFDVILHKISGEVWHQELKAYKNFNPNVCIFDPPKAIMRVYNRMLMLKEVAGLKFQESQGNVGVPKQVVVDTDCASLSEVVSRENLKFPLVAKPLWIDGSARSHDLSLVFDGLGLSSLTTPLVLQEFVNHGGVMFKVFVIGHLVKVIHRPSLMDVCVNDVGDKHVMPFPRISSAAALATTSSQMPSIIDYPPKDMISSFAMKLSSRLGLKLFNFDLIRDSGNNGQYYVIDINYFPGYGKVPEYEGMFTEFLLSIARKREFK